MGELAVKPTDLSSSSTSLTSHCKEPASVLNDVQQKQVPKRSRRHPLRTLDAAVPGPTFRPMQRASQQIISIPPGHVFDMLDGKIKPLSNPSLFQSALSVLRQRTPDSGSK